MDNHSDKVCCWPSWNNQVGDFPQVWNESSSEHKHYGNYGYSLPDTLQQQCKMKSSVCWKSKQKYLIGGTKCVDFENHLGSLVEQSLIRMQVLGCGSKKV